MIFLKQSNLSLPYEILKLIFEDLEQKEDLKACLLVCKSWNNVAQEYFNRDISIKLNIPKLPKLLDDIHYFALKVKSIELTCLSYKEKEEGLYLSMWRDILIISSNLNSLYVFFWEDTQEYLRILESSEVNLNKIQKITTHITDYHPPDSQKLYLRIQIRYCKLVTSLHIYEYGIDYILIEYGGLPQFISNFPNLIRLEVEGIDMYDSGMSLDMRQLLESAPLLQELKLDRIKEITGDFEDSYASQSIKALNLKEIHLETGKMNIKLLRFILSQAKNIGSVSILITRLESYEMLSFEENQEIIDDFNKLLTGTANINLRFLHGYYLWESNSDSLLTVVQDIRPSVFDTEDPDWYEFL